MKKERTSGLREAIELALDALRRNPLRSFLTVLGIVIGVATVIAVSAVVNGLNNKIVGSVESLGSNVIMAYRFQWASLGRPPSDWLNRPELQPQWGEDIAKLPHVAAAGAGLRVFQPQFGSGITTIRHNGREAENVILEGDPPAFQQIWNIDLASGRFAVIEKSREFTLVPWRPALEDHLGREVRGVATAHGIDWSIGRKRGLGL